MDQFAACYFCGAAVDTSLSERPVVPPTLGAGSDPDETLTLCSTCEGKLDAIVERVLEVVEAGDAGGARGAGVGASAGQSVPERDSAQRRPDADGGDRAPGGRHPGGRGRPAAGQPEGPEAGDSSGPERSSSGPAEASGPAGEEAEDDRQTVSALENSKVMRMLENREFPVEREPFEHVVANAYDVAPGDVSRVIDMAIDRGLVADRDGDLVRPE